MTTPDPGRSAPPWFANGYLWASLLVVACIVTGVAGVAAFIYGIGQSIESEFDDYSPGDTYSYYVDQESVLDVVAEPCVDMMVASQEVSPLKTDPDELVVALRGFAAAGQDIVTAIDSAGPDADSRAWRDDWVELVSSIEQYADDIDAGTGRATYLAPTFGGGIPITERMAYSSEVECGLSFGVTTLGDDSD